MTGLEAPGDLVKPDKPRSHHESPVMRNQNDHGPTRPFWAQIKIMAIFLPSPSTKRGECKGRKNHIHRIKRNGGWVTGHEQKEEAIHDHFY
jgi:hypothetical protein